MSPSLVTPPKPDRASARALSPPPPRILVVDDDSAIRLLNAEALRRSGYRVDVAEDGEAGWIVLRNAQPARDAYNLLITDHQMPGLTGLGLIKQVRAARMTLPVIMATAALPSEELARYPGLLPSAILLKPYTVAKLLATVSEVLDGTPSLLDRTPPGPNGHFNPPASHWRR